MIEEQTKTTEPKTWSRRKGRNNLIIFGLLTATVFVLTWWGPYCQWRTERAAAVRGELFGEACQFAQHDSRGEGDIENYGVALYAVTTTYTIIMQDADHATVRLVMRDYVKPELITVYLLRLGDGRWHGEYDVKIKSP